MSSETIRQAFIIVAVLTVCAAVLFMLWQAGATAHASYVPTPGLGVGHNDLGVEQPPLSKHTRGDPVRQTRDLSVMLLRVEPSSSLPGGNVEAIALVDYEGNEPAPTSTLRFYRSVDEVISSSDTELSYEVTFLPLEIRTGYAYRFTAPESSGTRYYGACVDAVADESTVANNCSDAATLMVAQSD